MLTTKVKQTIKRFGMLKPGDRVVVAVSGGPDSVCLLSILQALAKDFDLTLHIAHLDHMFRGRESAGEALFVEGLAKKLGIPASVKTIDVPAFCRERGVSPQEGARTVRYDFLHGVATAVGASRIATGHTADDQAETFIMRLLRGAGVAGLSSIPPVRDDIIRPLIEVTRSEVLNYMKEAGLEFMTDPSNAKPLYLRNKIRLAVLPVLKQYNPRIVQRLALEAALLRDEDEAVETYLEALSSRMIRQGKDGVVFKREPFNALPQAFKRRLFRNAVDLADGGFAGLPRLSRGLSSIQVDEALAFMSTARTGRTFDLPCRLTVEREYEKFILSVKGVAQSVSHTLALPGTTTVPELGLQIKTKISDAAGGEPEAANYLWQAKFDYDKILFSVILRTRLRGDRFCPAGMGGRSKKLQDFFVDGKIPRRKRDSVPLLVSGNDILWVIGLRTDERYLPRPDTKSVLVVQIKPLGARTEE
jgi:tRNA(Ile)-lysidine synthase